MRAVRFLVPGTTGRYHCGGLFVELQTARLLEKIATVEIVTYRQREQGFPFLADLLRVEHAGLGPDQPLWIVSWGYDVPRLLRRLVGRPVAYHAHSAGYRFDLPTGTPVVAVSRNTLGYWGSHNSRSPLFLVPNALELKWIHRGGRKSDHARSIDVLVQQRKTSHYVLHELVPALRKQGLRVEVQAGWVEDLVSAFNDAKVYLYDSADYWASRGVSEGFGLPPIEALACGCVVFSSFNHALADLLDPGRIGHQIGAGTLIGDVNRITAAVRDPHAWSVRSQDLDLLLAALAEDTLLKRWQSVLAGLDDYWTLRAAGHRPLRSHWLRRQPFWNWAAAIARRLASLVTCMGQSVG